MKHIWLKGAAVGAAVFIGSSATWADNIWRYYAASEEGNPFSTQACIVQEEGDAETKWVLAVDALNTGKPYELKLWQPMQGSGVLDLRDVKVRYLKNGEELLADVTSVYLNGNRNEAYNLATNYWRTTVMTEFLINHMSGAFPGEVIGNRNGSNANQSLKKVYVQGDGVTSFGREAFGNCFALTNAVIDCPNCTSYGSMFINTAITNEVDEIISPSGAIQTIAGTFGGNNVHVTGSLVITNLVGNFSLGQCSLITNLVLKGDRAGVNNVLSGESLRGSSSLLAVTFWFPNLLILNGGGNYAQHMGNMKEFIVYMPSLTNVYSGTLCGFSGMEKLYMYGPALPTNVVSELTMGFPSVQAAEGSDTGVNSEARRGVMYCSKRWGWAKDEIRTRLVAGSYEAEHAPADCFGVYVNVYFDNRGRRYERHVYLVNLPQPELGEPQGLCIRVQ